MTSCNCNGLIHDCYICYNCYKSVLNLLLVSIVRNLIWQECARSPEINWLHNFYVQ